MLRLIWMGCLVGVIFLVCSFEVLLRALLRSGLVGFWDFLVSGFGAGL